MSLLRRRRAIFLSSTEQDLRDERTVAKVAIEREQLSVVRMEDFVSNTPDPWRECAGAIATCDGYLLIIGPTYGTALPPSGLSFTHAEYELAQSHGLPTYVFVKAGSVDAAPNTDDGERLRDFHETVTKTHTRSAPFATLDDLERAIADSLSTFTGQKSSRPNFRATRRSETSEWAYALATLKHRVLAEHPFEVVLVDGKVAMESDLPDRTMQTRLLQRALEIRDELQHLGVTARMFNDVWAEGPSQEARFVERVRQVCATEDLIVCFVHGSADVALTLSFTGSVGQLALVQPSTVTGGHPSADHVIEYLFRDIGPSKVAADTMRYLREKISQHVEGTFRDVA